MKVRASVKEKSRVQIVRKEEIVRNKQKNLDLNRQGYYRIAGDIPKKGGVMHLPIFRLEK
jgi:ribosomal protein L36